MMPAEGVKLSGVRNRTGTKDGCGSGEAQKLSTEGARLYREIPLNLSGKRTEYVFADIIS